MPRSADRYSETTGFYTALYATLTFVFLFLVMARSLSLEGFGYTSSRRFHDQVLFSLFFAPFGFFERTPGGRILGRLSKDILELEMVLPQTLNWLLFCVLRVISIQIVIAATAGYVALGTILTVAVFYYLIASYYRKSGREIQRLVALARGPVNSKFTEIVHGLVTLRAFGKETQFLSDFRVLHDQEVKAYQVGFSVSCWRG